MSILLRRTRRSHDRTRCYFWSCVSTTCGTHGIPRAGDLAAVVAPSVGLRPGHAIAQFCYGAARVIKRAMDGRRFAEASCNFI